MIECMSCDWKGNPNELDQYSEGAKCPSCHSSAKYMNVDLHANIPHHSENYSNSNTLVIILSVFSGIVTLALLTCLLS